MSSLRLLTFIEVAERRFILPLLRKYFYSLVAERMMGKPLPFPIAMTKTRPAPLASNHQKTPVALTGILISNGESGYTPQARNGMGRWVTALTVNN